LIGVQNLFEKKDSGGKKIRKDGPREKDSRDTLFFVT